jgi:hypothetical protein
MTQLKAVVLEGETGIPRFGSCRSDDADYDPLIALVGPRFDVLLDGEPVRHVIAYDCNEGWVRAMRTRPGQNGRPVKYIQNGKAAEHTLRGNVSVRWR